MATKLQVVGATLGPTDEKIEATIAEYLAENPIADGELRDIRNGYDGTVYDTAGDAVRGQVGKLNDRVDDVEGQVVSYNKRDMSDQQWGNGYYGPGGGVNSANSIKYIRFAGNKELYVAGTRITLAEGYDGYINFYTANTQSSNCADERVVFSDVGNDYIMPLDRYVSVSIFKPIVIGGTDKEDLSIEKDSLAVSIFDRVERLPITESRVESMRQQINDYVIKTLSVEKSNRLVSDLSDIQSGTTYPSITIHIPNNTGEVIPNATARLALHKGVQEGDTFWNEIFSENFRDNFSGMRFFDVDGANLPYMIQSSGNYDFVKDSTIGTAYVGEQNVKDGVLHDSTGVMYKRVAPGVIAKSTDNGGTWETIIDRWDCYVRFIDSNNRMFIQAIENLPDTATAEEFNSNASYACGAIVSMDGVLYKCKSQDGYNGETGKGSWIKCNGLSKFYMIPQNIDGTYDQDSATPVLDLSDMMEFIDASVARWGEDASGNIFMGRYQESWVGGAIYRMAPGDIAFSLVYENTSSQHIHHITIDRYSTPNVIYASLDNANQSPMPVRSEDGGITWEEIPVPYRNRDFALKYIGRDFALGGGEANVLGGETLYRTTDIMNPDKYETVIPTHQGIRDLFTPDGGKTVLCGGVAAGENRVEQLFMSTDKGYTWKTVYANDLNAIAVTAGDGVRVFTDYFTPSGANEPQVIANGAGRRYGLRCYFGGNRRYALVYVNVGNVPADGKDITLNLNYLTDNSSMGDTIEPSIIEPVFWLPLNEGSGTMARTGTNFAKVDLTNTLNRWVAADGLYYTGMLPAKTTSDYGIIMKEHGSSEVGKIQIDHIDDFSVSFWLKIPDDTSKLVANSAAKFGREYLFTSEDIDIYMRGRSIGFRFGDTEVLHSLRLIHWHSIGHWRKIMVTVSHATNGKLTLTDYLYDGDASSSTTSAVVDTDMRFSDQVFSLGSDVKKNLTYPIADIRFYDHCLTADEVTEIQHGRRYVQIGQNYT